MSETDLDSRLSHLRRWAVGGGTRSKTAFSASPTSMDLVPDATVLLDQVQGSRPQECSGRGVGLGRVLRQRVAVVSTAA